MKKIVTLCICAMLLLTACTTPASTPAATTDSTALSQAVGSTSSSSADPSPQSLDIKNPSDCIAFMEAALGEIESERGYKQGEVLEFAKNYALQYKKSGDNEFIIFSVDNLAGTNLTIFADPATGAYRYLDVPNDYDLLTLDQQLVSYLCRSGQTVLHHPNFPYKQTYSFADKQWQKVHLPINEGNFYHKLGGSAMSTGKLERIDLTDSKARVVFNFTEFWAANPSAGGCLPVLYYSFDPTSHTATLSFSGISFADDSVVKQLEQLPGITNAKLVKTEVIDKEAREQGVMVAAQITFTVAEDYNLYGEYEKTGWDLAPQEMENDELAFGLWTEKRQ